MTPASSTSTDSGIATWDYAPAPETTPVTIAERHGLFIDGRFRAPRSRRYVPSINPATEAELSQVADASPADVDAAVAAARAAFGRW